VIFSFFHVVSRPLLNFWIAGISLRMIREMENRGLGGVVD